jgi:hypothetical protein
VTEELKAVASSVQGDSHMAYSVGQSWAALKKAWRAYKIAKVQGDTTNMLKYAERIRTLQGELGLPKAHFPDIGLN